MSTPQPQKKTFELYIPSADEDPTTVRGRMKAVRQAKEWSREQSYPVKVERADSRVNMTFRDGMLVRYSFGRRR